jgi:hypothetical protein
MDIKNLARNFLEYMEGNPKVISVVIYDNQNKPLSFENISNNSESVSAYFHRRIQPFVKDFPHRVNNGVKKIKFLFSNRQCNIYFFSSYKVAVLYDERDELNIMDSLVQEYFNLSKK